MPTREINGVVLHYEDQGAGSAVILLHGFPVDGRMWKDQLDALSSTHRVIAPDFRGFGRSSHDGPFTIDLFADDIHALANALDIMPFTLGGLSMGGYVALAYVRRYPQTLNFLMLVDTKADADSPEAKENRNRMIKLATDKGSSAITDEMLPKLLCSETITNKPHIVKKLRDMADNNPPLVLAQALAAMRDRPEQTGMLKSIRVPTLIVVGELDAVTPPAVAQAMQKEIPGAQLSVIPNAGHMSPMEQPGLVNDAMRKFLAPLK